MLCIRADSGELVTIQVFNLPLPFLKMLYWRRIDGRLCTSIYTRSRVLALSA